MENQREKLGQAEFEEVLIDNLSKLVINRNYIKQNQVFWDNLIFKLFEEYYFSREETSIRKQAKFVEMFLGTMFRHRPSMELPEDIIEV